VNTTAWAAVAAFAAVAVGLPWVASLIRPTRLLPIPTVAVELAQYVAGVVALGAGVGAGAAATATFLGRDVLPMLAGIHPAARIVLAVAFIAAVAWACLGLIPIFSIDLDQSTILAAAAAPLLAAYAAWGIGDQAQALLGFLGRLSEQTTGWIQ
jgi:hypothetical protein